MDIIGNIFIPFPFEIDWVALLSKGLNVVVYGSLNDYLLGVALTTEL